MKKFLLFVLIVALGVFALYRWTESRRASTRFTPAEAPAIDLAEMKVLSALDREYAKLVDAVVPSVVSITTSRRVRVQRPPMDPLLEQFFGRRFRGIPQERIQNSLGSGVIVSKEGHIVTNHHVIANVDEIKVQLHDGRELEAQLVGSDEPTDLAVLKVTAKDLVPLPFGDSSQVRVGQIVFAIGNPFGLQETVTQGIISAKGRRAIADSSNEFFQTDTAINPGNSGGPLVNLRGEIVGINESIFSQSGGWQGVGFAIPSNVARETLEGIIRNGRPQRGYLGVVIQELTPELAQHFGVATTEGALITEVLPDSPALKAGIQPGDILVEMNNRSIRRAQDVRTILADAGIGATVKIELIRQGETLTVKAQIAETPSELTGAAPAVPSQKNALSGIEVSEIPPGHLGALPENIRGVMVAGIQPDSSAAQVLQAGDVIEEINREPIASPADFQRAAGKLQPTERAVLLVARGKTRSFVVLQPR